MVVGGVPDRRAVLLCGFAHYDRLVSFFRDVAVYRMGVGGKERTLCG